MLSVTTVAVPTPNNCRVMQNSQGEVPLALYTEDTSQVFPESRGIPEITNRMYWVGRLVRNLVNKN